MRSPHHLVGGVGFAWLLACGAGAAWLCPVLAQKGGSPEDDLPPHIRRLTDFGERADFSHDGTKLLFVEKTFGDAYEVDLPTRRLRLLTGRWRRQWTRRASATASSSTTSPGRPAGAEHLPRRHPRFQPRGGRPGSPEPDGPPGGCPEVEVRLTAEGFTLSRQGVAKA